METNEVTFYKSKAMDLNESSVVYEDRYHYSTPLSSRYGMVPVKIVRFFFGETKD